MVWICSSKNTDIDFETDIIARGILSFQRGDEINSSLNFLLQLVFHFSITSLINDIFRSNLGLNHSLDGTAQGLHTDGTVTLVSSDLHSAH